MDPDPGRARADVELATHVLVGPVRDDAQLDRPALAVGQLRERRAEVGVEAVEPGVVDGDRLVREVQQQAIGPRRSTAFRRTEEARTLRAIPNSQGAAEPSPGSANRLRESQASANVSAVSSKAAPGSPVRRRWNPWIRDAWRS